MEAIPHRAIRRPTVTTGPVTHPGTMQVSHTCCITQQPAAPWFVNARATKVCNVQSEVLRYCMMPRCTAPDRYRHVFCLGLIMDVTTTGHGRGLRYSKWLPTHYVYAAMCCVIGSSLHPCISWMRLTVHWISTIPRTLDV